MAERVASVDIGSNSVLMLIAERTSEGWTAISDTVQVTRVSEGLDATGRLHDEPIARTATVLHHYAQLAREQGVQRIIATGTAPFRRGANGSEVALLLAEALGAPIDVVSGEREAALSLDATRVAFPRLTAMTVVDIGGASTEVIAAERDSSRMVSVDVGSVRLTERCVQDDPPGDASVSRVRSAIEEALTQGGADILLAPKPNTQPPPLIGIAGTVTTVATMLLAMDDYDPDVIHGYRIRVDALGPLCTELAGMTLAERQSKPGLPAARADVILAGALLLQQIAERAGVSEVIVSDRGTRWGRLAELG